MATTISRSTITDDDGTGTVGTVWDAASLGTIVYDKIDGLLSTNIVFGGTVDSQSSAEDSIATAGGVIERGRATAMGVWVSTTHASTNYGTSSSGSTFAVAAGDQLVSAYTLIGKTMLYSVVLNDATVSGSPSELWIDLPPGVTAARSFAQVAPYYSGSTSMAYAWVAATSGTDHLKIHTPAFATWPASTDSFHIEVMAAVPIA